MTIPFNPLDMHNLARSLGYALLERSPQRLDTSSHFTGAGVYALYYTGPHPLYAPSVPLNINGLFSAPCYIGKAMPAGSRTGGLVDTKKSTASNALYTRLVKDHQKSIVQAENLRVEDFHARWLVLDPIWIPLAESILIDWFRPLWNQHLDGFGNHDPGSGRYNGDNIRWDTLHPGRPWAQRLRPRKETVEELTHSVEPLVLEWKRYLRGSVHSALPSFEASELRSPDSPSSNE